MLVLRSFDLCSIDWYECGLGRVVLLERSGVDGRISCCCRLVMLDCEVDTVGSW